MQSNHDPYESQRADPNCKPFAPTAAGVSISSFAYNTSCVCTTVRIKRVLDSQTTTSSLDGQRTV